MVALFSQFGQNLFVAFAVFGIALVAAAVVALRRHTSGRPILEPTAQILALGSALVILAATALPPGPVRRYGFGDLVLHLGAAGLSNWQILLDDPFSWEALLISLNVVLYVPLGLLVLVGWRSGLKVAFGVCLGLSVAVETVQWAAFQRVAALDDVLINVAGGVIGIILGALFLRVLGVRGWVRGEPDPKLEVS